MGRDLKPYIHTSTVLYLQTLRHEDVKFIFDPIDLLRFPLWPPHDDDI
jgi:hypothetical protein